MRTNQQPKYPAAQIVAVFSVAISICAVSYSCRHQLSTAMPAQNAPATQSSSDGDFTYEMRHDIEPKLKSVLPTGWSISNGANSITLARNEKVFIYSSLNWPAFSEKSMDENVRAYGQEIVYHIILRFVPRLNKTEYAALRQATDDCHVDNPPGPTFSIGKWQDTQDCYRARQPPIYYTDTYSIYIDQPDWWSALKIYPEAAADESNKLHASLDELFRRYEKRDRRK